MSSSLQVLYGQPGDLMARIVDATDTPLVQTDVTTILYTVFSVDAETSVETGVTSYTSVGLAIVSTVVNTLSTVGWDTDTTGWNFRHTVPAAALATLDGNYHVVYTFTVQGNDSTAEFLLLTYSDEGADINADWGGADAESYVTWAYANSWVKTHILENSAWLAATVEKQKAALLQAALDLDSQNWAGSRYYWSQRRSFPRAASGTTLISQQLITSTQQEQMKEDVQHAQMFQAVFLLSKYGTSTHSEMREFGVTRATREVGPIKESFDYSPGASTKILELAPYALRLLAKYMGSRAILRA